MLCSRFKQILLSKTTLNHNVQFRCFMNARFVSKKYGIEGFWESLTKHRKELYGMGSVRFFKDLSVIRLWSAWTRSVHVGRVLRKYRKDRSVREVFHCFRQTFLRPRRSLLLYATAACKASEGERPGKVQSCSKGISDEELEALVRELDGIEELARQTLYCENCDKRIVINNQHPNIVYCPCKEAEPPEGSPDGWEPYMEADDVIIWRKEYKKGKGLFAYKVYGRYKDVNAADFAAVNLDGAYRRKWDNAVAALAVVERSANGQPDQTVLHWEVLWPRLFANRDYVYIRRHKEFSVKNIQSPHLFDDDYIPPKKPPKDKPKTDPKSPENPPESPKTVAAKDDLPAIFKTPPKVSPKITVTSPKMPEPIEERSSVHDNAKQKSLEMYSQEPPPAEEKTNSIYVIISRSCTHPEVPATRNAIRVTEYWSHMVVKTLYGDEKMGMEFVLTYYDEPAVGGMPSGVTAWATSRATPAFLTSMRNATKGYASYRDGRKEEVPDFTPFSPELKKVSFDEEQVGDSVKEEDMESSKTGPDMDTDQTKDESSQTDETHPPNEDEVTGGKGDRGDKLKVIEEKPKVEDKAVNTVEKKISEETPTRPSEMKNDIEKVPEVPDEEEKTGTGRWWWRPFYYFV